MFNCAPQSLGEVVAKISNPILPPLPSHYSADLQLLVSALLQEVSFFNSSPPPSKVLNSPHPITNYQLPILLIDFSVINLTFCHILYYFYAYFHFHFICS